MLFYAASQVWRVAAQTRVLYARQTKPPVAENSSRVNTSAGFFFFPHEIYNHLPPLAPAEC